MLPNLWSRLPFHCHSQNIGVSQDIYRTLTGWGGHICLDLVGDVLRCLEIRVLELHFRFHQNWGAAYIAKITAKPSNFEAKEAGLKLQHQAQSRPTAAQSRPTTAQSSQSRPKSSTLAAPLFSPGTLSTFYTFDLCWQSINFSSPALTLWLASPYSLPLLAIQEWRWILRWRWLAEILGQKLVYKLVLKLVPTLLQILVQIQVFKIIFQDNLLVTQ